MGLGTVRTRVTSLRLVHRVVKQHFPQSGSELVLGQVKASKLAAEFGTPLYAFDASVVRAQLQRVHDALGPRVEVLFALKANPSLAIASLLREAGAGAEVASAGEILVAREAGFAGEQIQFAGPGKHGVDIRLAIELGVTLNVESKQELQAIDSAAQASGKTARVALRVNPPTQMTGSRMRMSGGGAKFGIDAEAVPGMAVLAEQSDHLQLLGLHTYAGTQTFDHEGWLQQATFLIESATEVEQQIKRPLETLNFGGGFGVPVFDSDKLLDLSALGTGLQEIIAKDPVTDRRYFVELGRYLVAESGVFLTRVVYIKESRGATHAILDGGMNHHAAAAGIGTVIQRSFPMAKATDLNAEEAKGCRLGGPLCTPADAFPTSGLPALEKGDLVAFFNSGAYGLTFSNVRFLSHGSPAEVLVEGAEARLIRERGVPEDALRGQRR